MSIFSERLRALRGKVPKSVVSDDLGIKRSTFATYEDGSVEPKLALIGRIADYYHVTADYLLGLSESPGVSVRNNGDHSPVASSNVNCSECPLTRTVERQAALIEQLSQAAAGIAPKAPAKQARK